MARADIFAANAIIGEIFGEGGGDEALRSEFLSSLRKRYGTARGNRMFDDFSEFDDRDAPSTMTRTFRYGTKNLTGAAPPCSTPGSFKPTGPSGSPAPRRSRTGRATSCS